MLRSTGNPVANISKLMAENAALKGTIEKLQAAAAMSARNELTAKAETAGNCRIYSGVLEETQADTLKNIAHQIRQADNSSIIVIGSGYEGKAALVVGLGEKASGSGRLNAVEIIKAVSGEINGGGGGQPFLATAGGKKPEGLARAVARAVEMARTML